MKVLVVMGTRPEVIKLAPVVSALKKRAGLSALVCATAQHRQLLDQMLSVFGIVPDFDLNLMEKGQSPDRLASRVLAALAPVLARVKPSLVVVQGDTTTALAAALSAYYHRIPVAHVEAGLRSFDENNPYPEEKNRVVIDHLAALHLAPTALAVANLRKEGLSGRGVFLTGNTVVDALHWARARRGVVSGKSILAPGQKQVLVTLHRRESFGAPLEGVFRALKSLVERHEELVLVYPVHPNPEVRLTARRMLRHPRIRLIEPLSYLEFLDLMNASYFLLTDSGGLQEESVCLHKPVLVVRKTTERPEVIAVGAGRLVGLEPRGIVSWCSRLLRDAALHQRMSRSGNPYGDGRAGERSATACAYWLGLCPRPRDWRFKGG